MEQLCQPYYGTEGRRADDAQSNGQEMRVEGFVFSARGWWPRRNVFEHCGAQNNGQETATACPDMLMWASGSKPLPSEYGTRKTVKPRFWQWKNNGQETATACLDVLIWGSEARALAFR